MMRIEDILDSENLTPNDLQKTDPQPPDITTTKTGPNETTAKTDQAINKLISALAKFQSPDPQQNPLADSFVKPGEVAELYYRSRRFREESFPNLHLADPAWDILLDLYISYEKDEMLPVSSVAIGACVPQTTALRWINALERSGHIIRSDNPRDVRSKLLTLHPDTAMKMRKYFKAIVSGFQGLLASAFNKGQAKSGDNSKQFFPK